VLTAADGETALEVAERLRRSVEQIVVEERGRSIPLTISLGVGGQVFLTTTHPEFILLERDRIDRRVQAGVLEES
jgi:GGDEF domain-containing protein